MMPSMTIAIRSRPPAGTGARIRAARQAMGLSQDELAAAVGVTRSAVAQWETGRAGLVGGNLARVSDILGIPLAFLLTGAAERNDSPLAHGGVELALLRLYRECAPADQVLLLQTARRLAMGDGTAEG
jgi:transcriptional regulator with XRE-family HTH domain